jgi:hypothetical protein
MNQNGHGNEENCIVMIHFIQTMKIFLLLDQITVFFPKSNQSRNSSRNYKSNKQMGNTDHKKYWMWDQVPRRSNQVITPCRPVAPAVSPIIVNADLSKSYNVSIIKWSSSSPSEGTLNCAPGQGSQPHWHAKDRFSDFRKRVGSFRAVGETQTHKTEYFSCLIPVMWPKYCQNGVEP